MILAWLLVLVLPAVIGNCPPESQSQVAPDKPFKRICPVCRFVCRKLTCPPGSVEAQNAPKPCTCDNCPFCAVYRDKEQSCTYNQRFTSNRRKRQTSDVRYVCNQGLTCKDDKCQTPEEKSVHSGNKNVC